MRGRKPKPLEVHAKNGNPSKLNLAKKRSKTPRAAEADPAPPEWLSATARLYWCKLFTAATAMRVMTAADEVALAELCSLMAEVRHYRDELQKLRKRAGGDLVEGSTGNIMLHPYAKQVATTSRRLLNYLVEFGLTPSARSRIQIDQGGEVDDLLSFVASMN